MAEFIYIDNSNLTIEGMRLSAVKTGKARSFQDSIDNKIFDQTFRIDFGNLHSFIAGDDPLQIKRCMFFGSTPPTTDSIWKMAEKAGFEVVTQKRNASNREKQVDTGLVGQMVRDAYRNVDIEKDTITIVSGDADFTTNVEMLVADGFNVEVVFWGQFASSLKQACKKFINLDAHMDHLKY